MQDPLVVLERSIKSSVGGASGDCRIIGALKGSPVGAALHDCCAWIYLLHTRR